MCSTNFQEKFGLKLALGHFVLTVKLLTINLKIDRNVLHFAGSMKILIGHL